MPLLITVAPFGQWQIQVRRGRVDSRIACAQELSRLRFLPPRPSADQDKTPVARCIVPDQVAAPRPLICASGPRPAFGQQVQQLDKTNLSLPDGSLVSTALALQGHRPVPPWLPAGPPPADRR